MNHGKNSTPIPLHVGRGQLPLRWAVPLTLNYVARSKETLYHSLIWAIAIGTFNAVGSGWRSVIFSYACSLLIAFQIGFLSPILWRWRLVKTQNTMAILAANGILSFVVGYCLFYLTLVFTLALFHGIEAITPGVLRVFFYVSLSGFFYTIVGYYITIGWDQERVEGRLRHEAAYRERLAEEARVVALRAQINPHFFFNTLNTIASLIPTAPEKAERAVELLAASLRPVLMREQPMLSTIGSELEVARAYAEIEQLRLGDRLSVEFDVAESLRERVLPSLSLQPLLENAVRHGASRTSSPYRITLRARGTQDSVEIAITGHPEEAAALDNPNGAEAIVPVAGHALHNITTRLRHLFGAAASLTVHADPERHASLVRLTVPREKLP